MELTESMIRALFTKKEYDMADTTISNDVAVSLTKDIDLDNEIVKATIRSNRRCVYVRITYENQHISFFCDCDTFQSSGHCWHGAAVLLQYMYQQQRARKRGSAEQAIRLLREYAATPEPVGESTDEPATDQTVTIVPILLMDNIKSYYHDEKFPRISVTVGCDRQYVVRDLRELLRRFDKEETYRYGKMLTLKHTKSSLTPDSFRLLELLEDAYLARGDTGNAYSGYSYGGFTDKDSLLLNGYLFDRFFSIYEGKSVIGGDNHALFLKRENPQIGMKVIQSGSGITILHTKCLIFGGNHSYYIRIGDTLYNCDEACGKALFPFLSASDSELYYSPNDITDFCSFVLPRIEKYITLLDPDHLLTQYRPDECVPCFFFDYRKADRLLTARLNFRYHEATIPLGGEPAADISVRPDRATEKSAEKQLAH